MSTAIKKQTSINKHQKEKEEEGVTSTSTGHEGKDRRRPEVLVSFCHHIPMLEEKDLHFFTLAKEKFGFEVEQLPTVSKNHIFGLKRRSSLYISIACGCPNNNVVTYLMKDRKGGKIGVIPDLCINS